MASGSNDVTIDNATSVGDFQVVLQRITLENEALKDQLERNSHGAEQQLAQLRMDVRLLQQQQQAPPQADAREERFELVDTKNMSPAIYSGTRAENFKVWAKKIKAYTNAKLPGYRKALECAEKQPKETPIDAGTIASWNWKSGAAADSKLHDMLLLVTGGEAQGIVEAVPGEGFEAWRLINVRFNTIGELYTYDKMNAMMHQTACKHISAMPASIAAFEKDLKIFRERTNTDFPEVLKLPILIQMIPTTWKKEFETQLRQPGGVARTYDSLANQLLSIGNEERYNERRNPNDMDCDGFEKEKDDKGVRGSPGQHDDHDEEWSPEEWDKYTDDLNREQEARQAEINWLGQKGKKGKGKSKGKGGDGKGKGAKPDIKDVQCLWCNKYGHYRRDCPGLAQHKKDMDAERAKKGDHSPYVPPARTGGPRRGQHSLEDDYDEVVEGITGDDVEADTITAEEIDLGDGQSFEDFEEVSDDEDDDDGEDWGEDEIYCGVCNTPLRNDVCECQESLSEPTPYDTMMRAATTIGNATVIPERYDIAKSDSDRSDAPSSLVTPEVRTVGSWTAVSKSTPLADLFERFEKASTPTAVSIEVPKVTANDEVKSFYR